MHTLLPRFLRDGVRSSGGFGGVKKLSNKARRQQDDRAFAEFDAMMERLTVLRSQMLPPLPAPGKRN